MLALQRGKRAVSRQGDGPRPDSGPGARLQAGRYRPRGGLRGPKPPPRGRGGGRRPPRGPGLEGPSSSPQSLGGFGRPRGPGAGRHVPAPSRSRPRACSGASRCQPNAQARTRAIAAARASSGNSPWADSRIAAISVRKRRRSSASRAAGVRGIGRVERGVWSMVVKRRPP
jgi:hypothetical protein